MTRMDSLIRRCAASPATILPRLMSREYSAGLPGIPWKTSITG